MVLGALGVARRITSKDDNQFHFPAGAISLVLHGAVLDVAFPIIAQVKPGLQGETFQWDVALVEKVKSDTKSDQTESMMASAQSLVMQPPPSRSKALPETTRSAAAAEHRVEPPQPAIEQVPPIGQTVEVPHLREEPVEPRRVEVAEPPVETKEPEPVMAATVPEPAESKPVEQESVAVTSVLNAPVYQETPAVTKLQASPMDTDPVGAVEPQSSGLPAKADNRWLAESLWRRVAELKRYPNLSRMNGEEGKVILKAVIRSDGQLANVSIQKSSGYSALDEAAMEAVRLACPLAMQQAMGKPQIVVSLPIVYRLAN